MFKNDIKRYCGSCPRAMHHEDGSLRCSWFYPPKNKEQCPEEGDISYKNRLSKMDLCTNKVNKMKINRLEVNKNADFLVEVLEDFNKIHKALTIDDYTSSEEARLRTIRECRLFKEKWERKLIE